MSLLEISDLSVRYLNSSQWALEEVNISVEKEELIIIAGASGCGKSTLAQAILGLIPAFVEAEVLGKIKIKGKLLDKLSRREIIQVLGYVPQYPADFTINMLVEEEIAFSLENLAYPRREIQSCIKKVLDQLEISHLRYRLMTELSSGELQRVALATAIAPKPPILIFDEPMARIDPKSEVTLARLLRNLSQNRQLIISFEHRLDYLLPVADRVILLENGRVIADGEPRSLIDKLQNIDLPEVSGIAFPGVTQRIIDLDEAKTFLLKNFQDTLRTTS
ncbi:MAG: energy-coupling factor ABC transporter ATP-binding protein [Candidatus Hodarchaeota archaeon]